MKIPVVIGISTLIVVFVGNGCGIPNNYVEIPSQAPFAKSAFSKSTTDFKIDVAFEDGAEPYTGNLGVTLNNTWDITKTSFTELFQNHPNRTITVPVSTTQMTYIPPQNKEKWSIGELVQLGKTLPTPDEKGKYTVTVIFLKGTYNGNDNILGLHVNGYPFTFVFKDVVVSAGGDNVSQKYIEQATVVHEIGHSIGLVNNGLPMSQNHEDVIHPHHSTNQDCVMYWAVESKSDILSSLATAIIGSNLNLFGSDSLNDGQAYHP